MCELAINFSLTSLSLLSFSISCALLLVDSRCRLMCHSYRKLRALIAFELKSTAKTNNKVQNVKCDRARHKRNEIGGGRGGGGAQLLRSSKFVGFEQTVNWAQQPQQTAKPPTSPSPNLPFCIWQFDNNAGAQAQWGKHKRLTMAMAMAIATAIARCKWSYALRLWCASAPLPSPFPWQCAIKSARNSSSDAGNIIQADVANWFGNDNLQLCAALRCL